MALTTLATGTQTAIISTEHTLYTSIAGGVFVFIVDLLNMAGGDTLELRMKQKVVATLSGAYFQSFSGAQSANTLVAVSVPFPTNVAGAIFTLKQTAGTGRTYDYSILSL